MKIGNIDNNENVFRAPMSSVSAFGKLLIVTFVITLGVFNNSSAAVSDQEIKIVEKYMADYAQGKEVPAKYKTIFNKVFKNANAGDSEDQYNAAFFYMHASESNPAQMTKYLKRACDWFTKSAKQGHQKAQAGLGSCYADGVAYMQDFVVAYAWLNLASTDPEASSFAVKMRNDLAKTMTPSQIEQGQSLSKDYSKLYTTTND